MRSAITVTFLLLLLVATAGVTVWAWREIGAVEIGGHGLIALGLGAGFTILVGAGLMALMFVSSRRGYDERAHQSERLVGERWRPSDADEG
jgi:hypothetical protein